MSKCQCIFLQVCTTALVSAQRALRAAVSMCSSESTHCTPAKGPLGLAGGGGSVNGCRLYFFPHTVSTCPGFQGHTENIISLGKWSQVPEPLEELLHRQKLSRRSGPRGRCRKSPSAHNDFQGLNSQCLVLDVTATHIHRRLCSLTTCH